MINLNVDFLKYNNESTSFKQFYSTANIRSIFLFVYYFFVLRQTMTVEEESENFRKKVRELLTQ